MTTTKIQRLLADNDIEMFAALRAGDKCRVAVLVQSRLNLLRALDDADGPSLETTINPPFAEDEDAKGFAVYSVNL